MKVLLATVVALATVILCDAAGDPECKKRKSNGKPLHWANPDDCGRFYRCSVKNVKREIICPPEKEYNAKTGKCSPLGKGTCKLTTKKPIVVAYPITDESIMDADVIDAALANETDVCDGVVSGNYLPKSNYCREFYICNKNAALEQTCDRGSYFDPINANCIPDVYKKCWQNKCIGQKTGVFLPDESNCRNFYVCQNNETVVQYCDSGSYFNAKQRNCIPDTNQTCWQNKCIGQNTGTLLPDEEHCRDFYSCQNNETVKQYCDSGNYFNANNRKCEPDAYAKCWQNKCIGKKTGTYLPNYDSCLNFYICQNNETVSQQCNSGSYFNETSSVCMPDVNNTICWENYCLTRNNNDLVVNNADCYKYYRCQDKQAIAETCAVGSYFDRVTLSCESGLCPDETTTKPTTESTTATTTDDKCTCPGGYKEGDLLKHPNSCNLFYMCYQGELLEQSCLTANYFNADIGACMRDVNGTCADSKYRSIATRLKRSIAKEGSAEEPTVLLTKEEEPEATSPKCLGLYEEGELVPDAKVCQNFHICIGGELFEQSCGVGNYFNAREKVCQADVDGFCRTNFNALSLNEASICPGGYVSGDILHHPTDCDKFFICFESELQPSECGFGNRFDRIEKTCVPDTTGTCWPKKFNTGSNCTCPGGYVEGQMVPHPNDCRLYYICYDSKLIQSDCGNGNRFDKIKQACDRDTNNTCNPSANICKDKPNNVMLPNPAQCDGYYICKNGDAIAGTCENNDWFDPSAGFCVADIDAKCKSVDPCANTTGITLLPHPQCSKFYICNNGQTTVGNCKEGEGYVPILQRCVPGGCSNNTNCIDKPDGTTYPVLDDPHSFYFCLNGVEMKRQCGTDTIYNAKFGICMLQPSSDCNQQLCANATDGTITGTSNGTDNSFCECRNGSAYQHSCPSGYTFNKELNICYSNAPCDPSICTNSADFEPFVNRNDSQSFCLCVSNEPVSVKCPNNGTYYPNLRACRQPVQQDPNCDPNVCRTAAPYKTFSSNSSDTSRFCICMDGAAKEKKCLNGAVYSPKYGVCVSVESQCDVNKCKPGTTTFFPAVGDKESFCYCVDKNNVNLVKCPKATRYDDNFKACLADPCDQSYCRDPSHAYTIFPSKVDSKLFCYCDGNEATWRACGTGTVYNDDAKACVPYEPGCDLKLCANATIGNAYAVPVKNDSHSFCYCTSSVSVTKLTCGSGTVFDPTVRVCLGEELCEGKYKQYQTVANPAACNKYRICLNAKMLDLTCGNGLYYNKASNQCQPNDNGQCKITQDSTSTCPGGYKEGQFVLYPNDCQRFYICADSKLHESNCGDGNLFDEALGYCVRDDTGLCRKNSTRTCVGNYREGDLVPHPENPQLYFICHNALLQWGDCGHGNIFDKKQLHCVPALSGVNQRSRHAIMTRSIPEMHDSCIEGVKRSVTSNCSQYEICFNGRWTRTTCSQNLYYNSERQLCLEQSDDSLCAVARLADLPACEDINENQLMPTRNQECGKYLQCSRGKWRLKNCPKDQFFSAKLRTCITTENNKICHELPTQPNATAIDLSPRCVHTEVQYYRPDCTMFYMCLEGEWWTQYCPLGMYFNRTQNYCVPNTDGQCKSDELNPMTPTTDEALNCTKQGALRASRNNCRQYYVCVAGMWFPQTCSSNQYFNRTQEACIDEDGTCAAKNITSLCKGGAKQAIPLNCTAYLGCSQDGTSWQRFECLKNYYFDDVLKMCVPNEGSCASSGFRRACHDGDIKPHPDKRNCGEFLHCELHVGWQLGTCLKGYTYNESVQTCLPGLRDGNCTLSGKEVENATLIPKDNVCLGKKDGASVAHVSDCEKFYVCYNETNIKVQTCPNGSYFDKSLSNCRPNDGSCQLSLSGPCAGHLDGAFVANPQNCSSYYKCSHLNGTQLKYCAKGEYFHNVSRECRQDNGECRQLTADRVCVGQGHGVRMPHETSCNLYYVCVRDREPILVECPEEQKFSEALRRCLPDPGHECQNGKLIAINSTQSCTNQTDGVFAVDKHDCSRYYICTTGKALHKRCISGSYFDPTQLLCVPDNGSCPFVDNSQNIAAPDPVVCVGRHGDLMSDPANCNEFYVCINGKLRPERCYEHHFFNATINQCQLRNNFTENSTERNLTNVATPSQCHQQPTNLTEFCTKLDVGASLAEQGDCRRYIACNEDEILSQRCRNGESFDSLLGVCRQNDGTCLLENGERVGDCNGKHGQITRNADNCRGYFVCVNGQKISVECAKDEYFNKTLNLCQRDILLQCNATEIDVGNQTSVNSMITTLKRYPEEKLCANAVIGQRYVNIMDRCRSFYVCRSNGTVQYEHCPEGSLFHAATDKCEDAELVPCSKT